MDRLTHSLIKETSRSLKYYIEVKRRENAFVLNTNIPKYDSKPLQTKMISDRIKEYPSMNNESYSIDRDLKNVSFNSQKSQKQSSPTLLNPDKEMCREELNFHMRSYKFSPREPAKISETRLKSAIRSSSACSSTHESRLRSAYKLTRIEKEQLVDDAAEILAGMVKSRRTGHETSSLTQHSPTIFISQNPNPTIDLRTLPKNERTKDILPHSSTTVEKSKKLTKGVLCNYKISIVTGNRNGASTHATIRIRLFGTNGYTNFYELSQSETHPVPFLKNQTDVFNVETYHVGELLGITIGHDRKDMRASWFLNKVLISDPIRDVTYKITCNAWLSSKSSDEKTMRDFQVVSTVSHKKATNINGTIETNPDQHVLIGPLTFLNNRSIKPTNRISVCRSPRNSSDTMDKHRNRTELEQENTVGHERHRSPLLSATSSDTEFAVDMIHHTHSTSRTPSPTLNQMRSQMKSTSDMFKQYSTDDDRPPTRLENRNLTKN